MPWLHMEDFLPGRTSTSKQATVAYEKCVLPGVTASIRKRAASRVASGQEPSYQHFHLTTDPCHTSGPHARSSVTFFLCHRASAHGVSTGERRRLGGRVEVAACVRLCRICGPRLSAVQRGAGDSPEVNGRR